MTATTISLVTHAGMPDGAPDDVALAAALTASGATVRFAVWNDPVVDWAATSVTAIRSTWDYHLHQADWFDWLGRVDVATRLINPSGLVRWNSDKHYLLDLERAGIPIIPTIVLACPEDVPRIARCRGWDDVVIKPAIGASSHGAKRFAKAGLDEDAVAHAAGLILNGEALIQPYQSAVEHARERSLVYIDGRFAHAFTKPGFYGELNSEAFADHDPAAEELALADDVIAALPEHPTIARIDVVPGSHGPLLMEAELIEPQLALGIGRETTQDLVRALLEVS